MMSTFPGQEEAGPLLEKLTALPPNAVAMLERYARDEVRSRRKGGEPGLRPGHAPATKAAREALLREGLLHEAGDGYYALSDLGRQVVRLLRGKDTPPTSVAAALGLGIGEQGE